ncbi:MAG: glutaredoxin family protein [Candidatus Binatia bacterium]|nr:glutaredoxin family protein [Candidatus Binatia bacterium]
MARVTLYTKDGCVHCDRQRDLLRGSDDRVEEVNLTQSPQAMNELLKLTGGRPIVPVIVRGARIEVAPDGGSEV